MKNIYILFMGVSLLTAQGLIGLTGKFMPKQLPKKEALTGKFMPKQLPKKEALLTEEIKPYVVAQGERFVVDGAKIDSLVGQTKEFVEKNGRNYFGYGALDKNLAEMLSVVELLGTLVKSIGGVEMNIDKVATVKKAALYVVMITYYGFGGGFFIPGKNRSRKKLKETFDVLYDLFLYFHSE